MTEEDKLKSHISFLYKVIHDLVVGNQSAWIEWTHGKGAEAAMKWIHNGLVGPGHIPDPLEPYGTEAQSWYNANISDPFPVCYCGKPSNQLWMGVGACCDEHMEELRKSGKDKH